MFGRSFFVVILNSIWMDSLRHEWELPKWHSFSSSAKKFKVTFIYLSFTMHKWVSTGLIAHRIVRIAAFLWSLLDEEFHVHPFHRAVSTVHNIDQGRRSLAASCRFSGVDAIWHAIISFPFWTSLLNVSLQSQAPSVQGSFFTTCITAA